jgi:hypothetical protein
MEHFVSSPSRCGGRRAVRSAVGGFRQHKEGFGGESESAEERKEDGNLRGVEGKCLLRREGEEGRDHEGDAAEEIRERDPPWQTLGLPRPIGVAGFDEGQVAGSKKEDGSHEVWGPDGQILLQQAESRLHRIKRIGGCDSNWTKNSVSAPKRGWSWQIFQATGFSVDLSEIGVVD